MELHNAQKLIAEKKDYHKALERNGFHLPVFK